MTSRFQGDKTPVPFNPLSTELYLSNLKTRFLPRRKHSASVMKIDKLMLYTEKKIAVCSQNHTKHINTLCGQNTEFLNVKPGGT